MATKSEPGQIAPPIAGSRGQATKVRIEKAALDLFYHQGFRSTTMREITTACDLTPAAFYNHFKAKEDLLYALIIESFDALEREITVAVADAGPSNTEKLRAFVGSMTQWHCDNASLARVANREALELPSEALKSVTGRRRRIRGMAEEIIRNGASTKEFKLPDDPAPEVARVIAAATLDLVRSIPDASKSSTWRTSDNVRLYSTIVLRMVGSDPDR